jgi:hypothetical protein
VRGVGEPVPVLGRTGATNSGCRRLV